MVGFVFAGVLGTLLHFLFDWTGGGAVAALFSGVNESIWEHTKLLFYPMLLFALLEYTAWGRGVPNFWCVKLQGILLGLTLIPVIYYTYTGAFGASLDWINVAIFFIVAAVAYYWQAKRLQTERSCKVPVWVPIAAIALLITAYTVFTFFPPRIPLFQDPVTGTRGFYAIG